MYVTLNNDNLPYALEWTHVTSCHKRKLIARSNSDRFKHFARADSAFLKQLGLEIKQMIQ